LSGPLTLGEVAALVGGVVEGDSELSITGVHSLEGAGTEHLSFLANRRYTRAARASHAGAILVANDMDLPGRTLVRVDDPYCGFAAIMQHFHPYCAPKAGIDPKAWIAPDAQVAGARIEAFAWVGPGAVIGAGTWVETGAVVGAGATVGSDCRLMPKAVVMDGCTIGDRVWLNPGAVIGGEGFGFAPSADGHQKIPQAGDVRIGDDVEVGANSCVDRAALGTTHVRNFAKLDNLVQVGHAADVGEGALMVAYSGVAGSARLGPGVVLAAKAAVLGHLDIGAGTHVGVASAVTHNQEPGAKITGVPAIEHRKWMRSVHEFAALPELVKRVRELEKRLEQIEEKS
jgi:UDP-3-O-[3-hydroxymyristoyl] glucosamine N-acyltransferase